MSKKIIAYITGLVAVLAIAGTIGIGVTMNATPEVEAAGKYAVLLAQPHTNASDGNRKIGALIDDGGHAGCSEAFMFCSYEKMRLKHAGFTWIQASRSGNLNTIDEAKTELGTWYTSTYGNGDPAPDTVIIAIRDCSNDTNHLWSAIPKAVQTTVLHNDQHYDKYNAIEALASNKVGRGLGAYGKGTQALKSACNH